MASLVRKTDGYMGASELFKIDPRKIVTREGWNPRSSLDNLEDLKASIRDNGFYPDKPVLLYLHAGELELISGHRRLQSVLELIDEGVPIVSIPAMFDQSGDEGERLGRALAANQNSVSLAPLDEAHAFQRLFGYGWDVKRIAQKIGRSLSYVYGRLKLLEAESDVLEAAERGDITQTEIIRVVDQAHKDGVTQAAVLEEAVARKRQKKDSSSLPTVQKVAHRMTTEEDEAALRTMVERIAQKIGRSLSYVYGRLKLLEAESDVLEAAERGDITQTEIIRVVDQAHKDGVTQQKVAHRMTTEEDEAALRTMVGTRGIVWVVYQLLTHVDKAELLDRIHDCVDAEVA